MAGNVNRKTFYKNWIFWLVMVISLGLILAGVSATFGIQTAVRALTEPSSYLFLSPIIASITGAVLWVLRQVSPIWEEIRKLKGETEVAKQKAATVEMVVEKVGEKTETNMLNMTYLEKAVEAASQSTENLSRGYAKFSDDLQELIDKQEIKLEKLEVKLDAQAAQHERQIIAMKAEHKREIDDIKEAHKKEIASLQAQINGLTEENQRLKQGQIQQQLRESERVNKG